MAELAAKNLLELEPENGTAYVQLSNIYAKCKRWDEVRRLRQIVMNRGIKKEPGCSMIEMNGEVHEFVAGDQSHPRSEEIYTKLGEMAKELRIAGYVPDTSEVLLETADDERDNAIFWHSEKLAMAYGLISSDPNVVIRIVKNLRMCLDCHRAIKLLSKIYEREVVVRDRTRFHHFRHGLCTCRDYW